MVCRKFFLLLVLIQDNPYLMDAALLHSQKSTRMYGTTQQQKPLRNNQFLLRCLLQSCNYFVGVTFQ